MKLSRRQLLQHSLRVPGSMAISPLLLPFLQHARAEAGGGAPPRRFVFVVKSSGLTPAELVPQQMAAERVAVGPAGKPGDGYHQPHSLRPVDTLIDRPLDGLTLPQSLAALEPLKNRLAIVQGLSGKMCKGGHSSWFGAMGCYRGGGEHDSGNIIGPTIDGVLTKRLPGIFPHLGLALGGQLMGGTGIDDGIVYPGLSAIEARRPLPYHATPLAAYRELFSVVATSEDELMQNRLNGTLLDFLVDDVKRLEAQINGADKEKLDIYLDGFESLRERQRKLKGVEAEIRKHAPKVSDKYTSKVETDRIAAHFDIATAALIAGLTNVITIRPDNLSTLYTGLGIDQGVHGLGHGEGRDPLGNRNKIRAFHIEQIARMATKLQATPEGDGNMLDNTLIVYFSDAGEKHHASCSEWPFVLLGGLHGKIKATGRYIQYPSYQKAGHHTISNLYNTFAHAVGIAQDRFGQFDLDLDEAMQTGPLSELLA